MKGTAATEPRGALTGPPPSTPRSRVVLVSLVASVAGPGESTPSVVSASAGVVSDVPHATGRSARGALGPINRKPTTGR